MQVEEKLAQLAMNGIPFKVLLPQDGVHVPEYAIDPTVIEEGTIVGHVVMMPHLPVLIISRVVQACYETDDHMATGWPSHLITEPILHSWDTRTVDELPAPRFHLVLNTVQCILRLKA
jgi:hypothetical protein